MSNISDAVKKQATEAATQLAAVRKEVQKLIVGQQSLIDRLLVCLIARGHVLLEGLPGLAKTSTINALARSSHCSFSRIQFTPDLLPADITGTLIYDPTKGSYSTRTGPIFANLVLADEINRAPSKVQSALLEAMQEHQVTIGDQTFRLPDPFLVLATQNPIEQEGTYPLPEAQLDRFIMKVIVGYPTRDEERKIYRAMTGAPPGDPTPVLNGEEVLALQALIRRVPISDLLVDYTMNIVRATRKDDPDSPAFVRNWVLWGVGPRGGQSMILAAKARAALYGRPEVTVEDLQAAAVPVLRHRIVLSYNAEAEGQTPDTVIRKLIETIPIHPTAAASDPQVQRSLKQVAS